MPLLRMSGSCGPPTAQKAGTGCSPVPLIIDVDLAVLHKKSVRQGNTPWMIRVCRNANTPALPCY
jgi:hypothetical protein